MLAILHLNPHRGYIAQKITPGLEAAFQLLDTAAVELRKQGMDQLALRDWPLILDTEVGRTNHCHPKKLVQGEDGD